MVSTGDDLEYWDTVIVTIVVIYWRLLLFIEDIYQRYTEKPKWVIWLIWAKVGHYTDKKTHFLHIFESFCPCTDPLWLKWVKWLIWVFLCTIIPIYWRWLSAIIVVAVYWIWLTLFTKYTIIAAISEDDYLLKMPLLKMPLLSLLKLCHYFYHLLKMTICF